MGDEQFWQTIIASTLPNLGVGVIFLYLYLQERKWSRERDAQVQEMYVEAVRVKTVITTALDNNTKAIEMMTNKVERILERNQDAIRD